MTHATALQRLATCLLMLVVIGDACAQQPPRVAPATTPPAGECYQLSYSPDTVGYYLPAFVELVANDTTLKYWFVARWQGGDVQRPNVRESYKVSGGTAMWNLWRDSIRIESHTGLRQMSIHVGRLDPTSALPVSPSRAEVMTWKGWALAALDDGPDHVEGDVSFATVSCDAFHTRH